MARVIRGQPPGESPQAPEPKGLGDAGKALARKIASESVVEAIRPGMTGLDEKIRDWVLFRYRRHPQVHETRFQEAMSKAVFDNMLAGPMVFANLRYAGGDLSLGGGEPIRSGSVVGVNSSKRTLAYPDKWFKALLDAKEKAGMDELTRAVTSPHSPYKFIPFGQIESLREGVIPTGSGSGFLMLALVDERIRGAGLSQKLLTGVLEEYRGPLRTNYVFFYGRTPGLGRDEDAAREFREHKAVSTETLNTHLRRVINGVAPDWGVGFHIRSGAHLICGLPDSVLDAESLNCGFLGIYDLAGKPPADRA